MIADLARGFGYALEGLRWLRRPGIRRFVALPLAANVLLFAGAGWWLFASLDGLAGWVESLLPAWLAWLSWVLWPLAAAAFLAVAWFGFALLANLVGSPFNGLLAERVAVLAGRAPATSLPLWREAVAAPLGELRKLGHFILLAVPALLLFLVPGANVLAPLVWLAVSAWMLALEYGDYPMGNEGLRFVEQRVRMRSRRALALGFGAGMLLLTVVPVLNFLSMPAGVVGATLMWCRELATGSHGVAGGHC